MKSFLLAVTLLGLAAAGPAEDIWLKANSFRPRGYVPRAPSSGFVVGGLDADIADYPHQLSLRLDNNHMCGASVISSNWALSAAHCTFAFPDVHGGTLLSLKGGSSNRFEGGIVFTVDRVVDHPGWELETLRFDITCIHTVENMIQSIIQPIALDPIGATHAHGSRAVLSGWGRNDVTNNVLPTILQRLDKPIFGQAECIAHWSNFLTITDDMICAGGEFGRSACNSDSGGPLVTGGRQIGVVSFGEVECAGVGPAGYARIAYPPIRNWITEVTGV
ncbi:trypsin 3A1-like [Uranotaenia lowii]|uniref:trypsin 3A1-like n=1 Tax=Uranotaenia lowii TaxID=190385 RepID=UPI00247946B9|nr:trypsin 3A1-like [Uranotaenia lowii]